MRKKKEKRIIKLNYNINGNKETQTNIIYSIVFFLLLKINLIKKNILEMLLLLVLFCSCF